MAEISGDSPVRVNDLEERQQLKEVEDEILDLQMILDSTLDTVDCMIENYGSMRLKLSGRNEERLGAIQNDVVLNTLKDRRRDVRLYMSKVDALRAKVQSTARIVRLSSANALKLSID